MCHDISFSAKTVELITDLIPDIIIDHPLSIDFSVTSHVISMSHRNCLAIYKRGNETHLSAFEWGFMADFMTSPELIKKYRIKMANARAENLFDNKSIWNRSLHQRCLIAVNGIYEHQKVEGFKNKIPHYITLKHENLLLLPALYNFSPLPDLETGEVHGTFSIITREANELMKTIHNDGTNKHRMPLFMAPQKSLKWLDVNSREETQEITKFCIPSNDLKSHTVFTIRTTKPRPDGKNKFDEYTYNYPIDGIKKDLFN